MKSKDIQRLVLSKYEIGDGPTKIFRDLNGAISLPTIERWCKSIHDTGFTNLSCSSGRPRTIRKIKGRWEQGKSVSSGRILKNDLGLRAYKILNEPLLTDDHKAKRVQFATWIRTNFRKEDTIMILFSVMTRCSTLMESDKNVNFRKRLLSGSESAPEMYHL